MISFKIYTFKSAWHRYCIKVIICWLSNIFFEPRETQRKWFHGISLITVSTDHFNNNNVAEDWKWSGAHNDIHSETTLSENIESFLKISDQENNAISYNVKDVM